jgi:hypothetical protein
MIFIRKGLRNIVNLSSYESHGGRFWETLSRWPLAA